VQRQSKKVSPTPLVLVTLFRQISSSLINTATNITVTKLLQSERTATFKCRLKSHFLENNFFQFVFTVTVLLLAKLQHRGPLADIISGPPVHNTQFSSVQRRQIFCTT